MDVVANRKLRCFAFWLAMTRVGVMQRLFVARLVRRAVVAFRSDSHGTVSLLIAELASSTSPRRNAVLLAILRKLLTVSPDGCPAAGTLLQGIPGHSATDRILLCQRVLHACFPMNLFREELIVELEPTETCGISESLANLQPQRLDISLLSEQHEQAVDDWMKTHDIDYANAVGPKSRFLNSVQAAASRGDAEAKYLLGLTYSDGFGVVAQDLDKSTRLLTEAAEAGNPKAQCTLGILYCLGYNVEKNPCAGRMWLDRSAQHGNEVARRALRLIKPEYDQR